MTTLIGVKGLYKKQPYLIIIADTLFSDGSKGHKIFSSKDSNYIVAIAGSQVPSFPLTREKIFNPTKKELEKSINDCFKIQELGSGKGQIMLGHYNNSEYKLSLYNPDENTGGAFFTEGRGRFYANEILKEMIPHLNNGFVELPIKEVNQYVQKAMLNAANNKDAKTGISADIGTIINGKSNLILDAFSLKKDTTDEYKKYLNRQGLGQFLY